MTFYLCCHDAIFSFRYAVRMRHSRRKAPSSDRSWQIPAEFAEKRQQSDARMKRARGSSSQGGGSTPKRQRPQDNGEQQYAERMEPREAEVGIVEHIHLRNFMCHSRLDVPLYPHVNFIVGNNGSGKSAVVTALVVGLGGKAAVTNRGTQIKSFIKYGKQTGEVEIRLRNRGPDAYRPTEYGDSITVVRKFSADGGSRYMLKSVHGKLVSDKREELHKILDQFNIQVDNPVAILNQDTSRNFLHSKNACDKYKFFLKATQLEQMQRDYELANERKTCTIDIITVKEKMMPKLKVEVCKWEDKFKNLGAISDLREKVKSLKQEMAWAFVYEKEKKLEPLEKNLRVEEARLPKFVEKAEQAKAKVEECSRRNKALQEEVKRMTVEAEKLLPLHKEQKEKFNAAKIALRAASNETKNIERDLRSATSEREQIQTRIHELQQTAQHDYEAERRARQQKMEMLEEQIRSAESRQRTTHHEREQYQAAVSRYKEEVYSVSNLQTLQSARSNRLKRFGAWVPSAIAKIDEWHRQGRFHQKPRGPLGACFQLADQSWSLGVEACLRALIHSFVCHDHHDEKLLEQILIQECPNRRRPAIITCRFRDQRHDVSKFCVRNSQFPTVLDILQCEDPVVANALIDQRGVENVILIADAGEARTVMMRRPPTNCKEAFTREGDQLFCLPTFRYYSTDMTTARFLTSDVEEEIIHQKRELERLAQEVKDLAQRRSVLSKDIAANAREEKKCETQLMKIGETITNLKYELNELRCVEDPAPVDISTLEEDVRAYTTQITTLQERRAMALRTLEEKQQQCGEAEKQFKEIEAEMKKRTDSDIPLKEELSAVETELDTAKQHRKHYETKLSEQEKNIKQERKKVQEMKKEIEITLRIEKEEKSQGDPEEITRCYNEKKTSYLKMQKEVKNLKRFIDNLAKVMAHREEAYSKFQRMIALRTKYYFIVMLSHRKYLGKMTFNHAARSLEMWVSPTEDSQMPKDLKTLSGGERSFSTVCFILSLWNAMESPFRCLDEFDVFMDMVNRQISMDMMLEVAKSQMERQFIFLTPQDMSSMRQRFNFRIFQMPNPDRTGNQSTLPFRPVGQARAEEEEED
ncbi:hypothetical protein BaRGS_00023459 [Batillaria attramentaria]|uniref:RecF/RecN/SMC N-terminal domain-containing protein n=1 Tax=Batillaria attramentaria TaxID=370345 RepID=A0ABD0KEI9_9CAEN